MKKDHVIEIYGAPVTCWFAGFDDEAETQELNTTSDPVMAARYDNFKQAREDVWKLTKLHPVNSFRVGELEPLNTEESTLR